MRGQPAIRHLHSPHLPQPRYRSPWIVRSIVRSFIPHGGKGVFSEMSKRHSDADGTPIPHQFFGCAAWCLWRSPRDV